jgi:hypothetical protein
MPSLKVVDFSLIPHTQFFLRPFTLDCDLVAKAILVFVPAS